MDNIKVLLIDKSNEDSEQISETLANVGDISLVGIVEKADQIFGWINNENPDVILLGTNLEVDRYELAETISSEYRDVAMIMIENELGEDTMYRALSSGTKDVIITPFTSEKLIESIIRTAKSNKEQLNQQQRMSSRSQAQTLRGHILTVFSTKGGVGKTFVATNLAVSLAKNKNHSVCIIDLDLDFGNVALALNVVPRITILDTVDDIRNVDQDVIESYLIPHESGIMVLPANQKPQMNEFVTAEHVEIILRSLRGAFDYVVVDMPARFHDPVNPAFQAADMLLMVSTPEISALRNVKASIDTLHELNFPKSKLKIVLNKANSNKDIKNRDIENTLDQLVYGIVEFDAKKAVLSLNNGIPITLSKTRSSISKSFITLANKINKDLKGM